MSATNRNQNPYGTTVTYQADVTATVTSTQILAQRSERNYLIIQNKGSVAVLVKFGGAHSSTEGVSIPAGGNYEPYRVPSDSIFIETISSTALCAIVEGV